MRNPAAAISVALLLLAWTPGARAQVGSESVGINTHVPSDDVLDACVDLGLEWVRIDANWRDIHAGPGRFETADVERIARSASARGLSVFMTLAYTPEWVPRVSRARDDAYGGNDEPATSSEWVAFVDEIVRRMRPLGVRHFGLWNEANLDGFWEQEAGLDAWIDKIVLPGAAAVRAACADCVVLGPELANVGPSDVALDQVLARTAGIWDIVTHHIYQGLARTGGGDTFTNALDRRRSPITRASLRELLDLHGIDREVWITETGYRAEPPGDADEERAQRDHVTGVLDLQLDYPWWTNTFFYEIYDCGVDQPGCDIDGYGLLRPTRGVSGGPRRWPGDYRQKPAFTAMRDLLAREPALLGEGPTRACANGRDDDGDGRIDLTDRGCASQVDDDESDDPARRTLTALRNPRPMVLDGRLEEWSGDGFVTLGVPEWFASAIGRFGPVVASDLGASLGARWEGDTLFVAVRVTDDVHVAREPNERLYLDDSIQIAFDPAASGGRGYDGDDEEWGCVARPAGAARFAGDGSGVLCFATREGDTTSYELAIPRSALPEARYGAGARLRFSMLVNEDDGEPTRDGTGREGWLELTRSIGASKNPESFAELVFEDRVAREDLDAGSAPGVDAGADERPDASTEEPGAANGCACRASSHREGAPTWLAVTAGVVLVLATRRRARRRSGR
jgi:hypothetical protein